MATRRILPTALFLAVALLGCGGDVGGPVPTDTDATASSPASEEPTVPRDGLDLSPGLQDQVDLAIDDLAGRLGVDRDAITVVSAEEVSWGDTSLGCPQPGMRYAQVVTDGVKIALAHEGTEYPYHAGGERPDPFLCEQRPTPDDRITDPAY